MAQEKSFIVKVYKNRKSQQKLVTIPAKYRDIKAGDYVKIIKVKVIEF